jgi:outer membrane receptor for ferrienterochelin and colicins
MRPHLPVQRVHLHMNRIAKILKDMRPNGHTVHGHFLDITQAVPVRMRHALKHVPLHRALIAAAAGFASTLLVPGRPLLRPLQRIAAVMLLLPAFAAAQSDSGSTRELDSLLNISVPPKSRSAFQISTASKSAQTESEAPASVTVVTSGDIERYGYRTIADLLNSVAGFYLTDDRTYTYLGVRGFGLPSDYNNRLLLLLDGHALNENIYGSVYIGNETPFDLATVDRVEIVRGPFPLYGNSAMFAVVNIVTKKGRSFDGIRASGGGGSHGAAFANIAWGTEFRSGWDLLFSGSAGRSDGEDIYLKAFDRAFDSSLTSDGRTHHLDWEKYLGTWMHVSRKNVSIQAGYTSRRKEIPTASWGSPFGATGLYAFDERGFAAASYAPSFGSTMKLTLTGSADYYGYRAAYPAETVTYDHAYARWASFDAQFKWDFAAMNRITAGAGFTRTASSEYSYWDADTTYVHFNDPYSVLSGFLQDEWQIFDNLAVTGGLRFEARSGVPDAITPRASIVWLPESRASIKCMYGEGFRNPSVDELYFEDPTSNYKRSENLHAERIHSLELAGEFSPIENLTLKFTLYQYKLRGLISKMLDTTDGSYQFRNGEDLSSRGMEFETHFHATSGVMAYFGYSYQETTLEATSERTPNSPPHLVKAGMSIPLFGLSALSLEARHEAGRRTLPIDPAVSNAAESTDAFTLVHLHVITERLLSGVRLWGSIRNIFDTVIELPVGVEHVMRAVPQTRRTLTAGITVEF